MAGIGPAGPDASSGCILRATLPPGLGSGITHNG